MSRIINISLWIYAGSLLIWLITRTFTGDGSLFVLSFSYLGVWLFLPLVVFVPWAIHKRSKIGFILLFIPIGLFTWFYGAQFIPQYPLITTPRKPLSVLTFNLMHTNTDIDALVEVLDSNQVDILALQEINEFHTEQLSSALKGQYPYDWYYPPAGLAIYSRHPILSREIYPAQPWPIQSAIIQVHGEQIQVINAHLAKPGFLLFLETRDFGVIRDLAAARIDQIDRIKESYHENSMPSIITCDCNVTNLTAAYAQLAAGLDDVFRERGWGLGHTFLIPRGFDIRSKINLGFQRIDYIFHSPEIEITQVRVVSNDSGSDHRPVWAQFELNP